jgi:hypothetical protein
VRVPTAEGDVWFKEAAPSLAFEPALTEVLAGRYPDSVPRVLAAEGPRMLTADAGPRLRTLLDGGEPAPSWEEIVALYAELQIELAEELDAVLALGVPDSRPEVFDQSLGGPVPLSLIHEEVHDGNVHVRQGRPVFIDWAEASVSHPFAGLTNTLRAFTDRYGHEPGGPEVLRIRDAYLEPWTRYAPLDELRALFTEGYALGMLVRALTWERIILPLAPSAREDYEHNIAAWREIHADALRAPDRLGA